MRAGIHRISKTMYGTWIIYGDLGVETYPNIASKEECIRLYLTQYKPPKPKKPKVDIK